jgi:phage terminase large subunit
MPCPYKEEDFDAVYSGMDFGFEHPSVIVKIGFKDGAMYSFNELCCEHKTNMEFIQLNKEFNILHPGERCIGDSAEPARIKEWVQSNYGVVPAIKGKDSVSRGIDFIKSQRWYIDPDKCPRTLQEAQVYHRKTDKNGQVNSNEDPVNLFDDAMKAHMYALEPLSRSQGKPSVLSGSKSDAKKGLIEIKKEERKKMREAIKEKRKAQREIIKEQDQKQKERRII